MAKVDLQEVARALMETDRRSAYIDLVNGMVILESDFGEEREICREMLEDDGDRYVPLPNLRDSVEKNLMQGFAEVQKSEVRARLLTELAGIGGAVRFERQVKRLFLQEAWSSYQERIYCDLARDFCEENDIPMRG